jgi:hypothetical protein
VSRSETLSLLDVLSGYNQVLVVHEDQLKTTFRTKWETYAYRKIPFRLINIGAIFQRAMDVAFRGLLGESVVVYLDDLTIFSKNSEDHMSHLKKVFNRCRRYGISLNPKKSIFTINEGKLMGLIVSKQGMWIEPERTEAIAKIPPPQKNKFMQSFLGRINFMIQSIPIFVETIKPLQDMIKNNVEFRWGSKEKDAFDKTKEDIVQARALLSPYFDQDFILDTFSSHTAFLMVLT